MEIFPIILPWKYIYSIVVVRITRMNCAAKKSFHTQIEMLRLAIHLRVICVS